MRHRLYSSLTCMLVSVLASALWGCDSGPGSTPDFEGEPETDNRHILYEEPDSGLPPDLPADAPGGQAPVSGLRIQWAPCTLYTGQFLPMAECGRFLAPLYRADQGGERIELFIKRARASNSMEGSGQLWLLAGGPGLSAEALEPLMGHMHETYPHLDIYTVDHRGTGQSDRLSCPEAEHRDSEGGVMITLSEWSSCISGLKSRRWDQLAAFSTSDAAHDLALAIERTRRPGQDVYIYGSSYGTWLALRYLQLYPQGSDGVILDSVCPPGACDLSAYDAWFDEAGHRLLDLCAEDQKCRSYMGADPMALARRTLQAHEDGRCMPLVEKGIDRGVVRRMLASLLSSRDAWPYVPALIYRLGRCTAGDVSAITHLYGLLSQSDASPTSTIRRRSPVLFYHVGLSELWPEGVDAETLSERVRDSVFSQDVTLTASALADQWPRYPQPDVRWPASGVPMLALQGGLDPQVPPKAVDVIDMHLGPRQHLVTLPWSGHQTLYDSPVHRGTHCAQQLMDQFLADPKAELDTACVSDLVPVSFEADRLSPDMMWGTPDLWD
ncbi:MAG: alpha/beta fold hydrolase [Bradymonadia bacterium]